MNTKQTSFLVTISATLAILTGCTTVNQTTMTAPSPQTAASQPTPVNPTPPENAVTGNPSKDFLLNNMTQDLDNVWNTDTTAGQKNMCELWIREPNTVLNTLASPDNGTATPVGVTINDIRTHLTGYFNEKCDTPT